LLLLASRPPHESQPEAQIYRFPTILIRALQIGTFVPIFIGIGNYRGRLELYGDGDRRLCKIDGGVQDFDDMVDAVESRCPSHILVREQDQDGKWSERSTT
jgi:hypothetical protein